MSLRASCKRQVWGRVGVVACALLAASVVLTIWVFVSVSRSVGRDGLCKNNLKLIQLAVGVYAEQNGGYLPPRLDVLVDGRYFLYTDKGEVEELLRCPVTGQQYLYLFEGEERRMEELEYRQPLVTEPGFPHGAEPFKYTMSVEGIFWAAPEKRMLARLERDLGRPVQKEDVSELEQDPARLAKLLYEEQRAPWQPPERDP